MVVKNRVYGSALIQFLLWVLRIGFFLFAHGVIIWLIYSIFIFITGGPTRHMDFPVMFSFADEGSLKTLNDGSAAKFYMRGATGAIMSDDVPRGFLAIYSFIALLIKVLFLLSLRLSIRILDSVRIGKFFIVENAIRLRYIGLLGIVFFILDRLGTVISASYFSDRLEFSGMVFTSFNLFSWVTLNSLFISLFLLVIAEAFRIGAQLKAENDLTI
ncbi:DUF2975 domain-containing protein [Ulvibacterium sp.]|uniref:DUF2975 domain-containing protein n=1 Tax=Ulvibacterium sp. TaxID=2665914 RepID=UPI003BAD365A